MSTSSDSDGSNGRRFFKGSKTYECKICGNEFKSGQSLGGHMNVHRRSSRSSESSCNATSSVESSATYKGVRYRSEQNKWVAEIRPPRSSKTWWLGTYNTAIEAAYAYDVAIVYFSSETSLNFYGHPVYDQIPTISPNLPKEDFAVQLRKVVKKYGRMAMESGPSHEEEASSSISQQEEPSFDDVIDWSVALGGSTECDTSFLDLTPQCDSSFTSNGSYYDPEPANYPTSDHYNYQVSSNYDPSGHYNYEYSYPQQQLWSPSPSYYGGGY